MKSKQKRKVQATYTEMVSMHNMRILRFLIVLAAVVLTIFIYASYSSNTSLAPPHMRSVSPSAIAAALNGGLQPQATANKTGEDGYLGVESSAAKSNNGSNGYSHGQGHDQNSISGNIANSLHSHIAKVNEKKLAVGYAASSVVSSKKTHYRQPTIDDDAAGGGGGGSGVLGGGSNTANEAPDEAALEHLVSNDLLEEQYGQNIDNTLGNINNSNVVQSQPLQQALQQQVQIVDNNLNKILDSDVLIPTSNLQKFIENADKILKNITIAPPTQTAANKSTDKEVARKNEEHAKPQQSSAVAIDAGKKNNDEPLPPSVIMTISQRSESSASGNANAPAPALAGKTTKPNVAKASAKSNVTAQAVPIDPAQGILTQQIYESGHMNEEIDIGKLCPNKGADLKLLILITSAQSHAEARLAIRQTWAHYGIRRDVTTAFILGRTTNETMNVALKQENFIYGDLIRGHFIDSYNNLTLKTISALEWVDEHCSRAKYVLKTDDDMFINVPKLLTFLDNHAKEKRVIFGRLAKKWKPIRNKKSKYYVSTGQFSATVFPGFTTGPAYVMSSDIIHELYGRALQQVYLKLEDVFTTGIVAQQLNIKRIHVNEFLNRRIAFNPCNIRKTISVHMIKSNEQFDLWKKLLDQTTKCK